jgi:hypothetical protein
MGKCLRRPVYLGKRGKRSKGSEQGKRSAGQKEGRARG